MGERNPAVGRLSDPGGERPALVVLAGGLAKRYGGCKPLAPVGLHGEAVIDLTVSDALAAGFGRVVMVLGPQTGSAIEYHVRRSWPSSVRSSSVVQPVPLGTAHALLCARAALGGTPFAVVNADDVYGAEAMNLLFGHLSSAGGSGTEHAMVTFSLRDTVVSEKPVTRGTCVVDDEGLLVAIVERRKVTMREGRARSDDGLEPEEIDPSTPVSVNLWAFTPAVWPVLEDAVTETHPGVAPDGSIGDEKGLESDSEVLLPEVIGDLVSGRHGEGVRQTVRVLRGPGRCLGVTHPEDLPIVRSELASMIGQGERPESPWERSGGGISTPR
jgi:GTP:adenosylcobinamide-phosphate guanylyltransferase